VNEPQLLNISETQEILRLAGIARRRMDFFSTDDLIRAAAEMNVPEAAIREAEQLVKERQSEADDRAEFRRAKILELAKAIGVGVPVILFVIWGHAIFFVSKFGSAASSFLKPLGAILFSRSTRHELEFREWRSRRFYRAEYGRHDSVSFKQFLRGVKDYHVAHHVAIKSNLNDTALRDLLSTGMPYDKAYKLLYPDDASNPSQARSEH